MDGIKRFFKTQRELLKPMTPGERFDHIWTYFKFHILVIVFAVAIAVTWIVSVVTPDPEVLLAGVMANVDVTLEGQAYMTDAYYERIGGGKNQKVMLNGIYFGDVYGSFNQYDYNYNTATTILSSIAIQELDYLLMNDDALRFYMSQEILLDLRECFTEEELESLKDKLVYLEMNDGTRVPMAIHIEDIPFAKMCLGGQETIFFSLIVNTPRLDTCRDFWDYLNAWEGDAE